MTDIKPRASPFWAVAWEIMRLLAQRGKPLEFKGDAIPILQILLYWDYVLICPPGERYKLSAKGWQEINAAQTGKGYDVAPQVRVQAQVPMADPPIETQATAQIRRRTRRRVKGKPQHRGKPVSSTRARTP